MVHLYSLALSVLTRRQGPPQTQGANQPATEHQDEADSDHGCGWFDSSHELHCGLLVREHATPDALATELPLLGWLELHLSCAAAAGPLQPTAG